MSENFDNRRAIEYYMNEQSGAMKSATHTTEWKLMTRMTPEYRARLERRIKIAVGLLPEQCEPVTVPLKFSKTPQRLWPQRQARPFSSNGARALRR